MNKGYADLVGGTHYCNCPLNQMTITLENEYRPQLYLWPVYILEATRLALHYC
jgi:hypothetical protein